MARPLAEVLVNGTLRKLLLWACGVLLAICGTLLGIATEQYVSGQRQQWQNLRELLAERQGVGDARHIWLVQYAEGVATQLAAVKAEQLERKVLIDEFYRLRARVEMLQQEMIELARLEQGARAVQDREREVLKQATAWHQQRLDALSQQLTAMQGDHRRLVGPADGYGK